MEYRGPYVRDLSGAFPGLSGGDPMNREARERALYAQQGGDPAHFDPVPEHMRRWFQQGQTPPPEAFDLARLMGSGPMSGADLAAMQGQHPQGRWLDEMVEEVEAEEAAPGFERTPPPPMDLSPEVMARIAEVLGNSRMWTPPPEWTSPPPSPSVAPPTTPPPQPLWSAGRDYLRPSDEFGAMRRTPGLGAPVPSEERSLADRLRPPYTTPMPGANPANAGASRMLEQGFGRLDPAAQRALQRPGPRLDVGQSPEGAPGALETGAYPRTAWARTPEQMVQQLMRELEERGAY